MISEKANRIGDSPTFKVAAKAKAMQAEGIDVVDLSLGEPDFPTPENIKAAGIKAIQQNFTKYTATGGTPDLKKAIIARLKEDNGLTYAPNEIIVSTGAKSSLFHAIQTILDEGEELIIPAPYWVTYPHLVTLAKGKSVIVPTKEENGFTLTPDELRAHITPATKALLLNSPSNPTGRDLLQGAARSPGRGRPQGGHPRHLGRDLRQARLRRVQDRELRLARRGHQEEDDPDQRRCPRPIR